MRSLLEVIVWGSLSVTIILGFLCAARATYEKDYEYALWECIVIIILGWCVYGLGTMHGKEAVCKNYYGRYGTYEGDTCIVEYRDTVEYQKELPKEPEPNPYYRDYRKR